ncbi:short-chain dehydrogenase/reductase [Cadophora sp. DSE1049]|nr:short-chain dehydrogenase/reductase [Cadophora sp. DSE1049]
MSSPQKYALITGCSANGLGAALVEIFLQHNYHVFATLRNPSKAPSHFSSLSNITLQTLDVLSPSSIASAVDAVTKKTGGRLDVLVNNSGRFDVMPGLDVSIEEGKKLFDLNFWAPLAMIQAFVPLLVEARGCVVNNGSVAAVLPLYFQSIYSASKAALINGSEIWRLELALLGVRTLTVMTGSVRSNVFKNMSGEMVPETSYYATIAKDIHDLSDGRLGEYAISAEAWAKKVVDAVEKGTTGKVWFGGAASAMGWMAWLLPGWVMDKFMTSVIPWAKKIQR